jgi:hypothetical protein
MKKEGRVLRKKAVAEGATLPLDSLYQRMEKFILLEEKKAPASPPSSPHPPAKQRDEVVSVVSFFVFVLFIRSYIDVCHRQSMQPTRTSGTLARISIQIFHFMHVRSLPIEEWFDEFWCANMAPAPNDHGCPTSYIGH